MLPHGLSPSPESRIFENQFFGTAKVIKAEKNDSTEQAFFRNAQMFWTPEEDKKLIAEVKSKGKIWKILDVEGRSAVQCRHRYLSLVTHKKGPFSKEEDERIMAEVREKGPNWSKINVEGRSGKQCRERYLNYLQIGLIKGPFSMLEKITLKEIVSEYEYDKNNPGFLVRITEIFNDKVYGKQGVEKRSYLAVRNCINAMAKEESKRKNPYPENFEEVRKISRKNSQETSSGDLSSPLQELPFKCSQWDSASRIMDGEEGENPFNDLDPLNYFHNHLPLERHSSDIQKPLLENNTLGQDFIDYLLDTPLEPTSLVNDEFYNA